MQQPSLPALPALADILQDNPGWLDEAVDSRRIANRGHRSKPCPACNSVRSRQSRVVAIC